MKELDVGALGPTVFTRLEWDAAGLPVACFVSADGEAFCLERAEVELRVRYLRANGLDAVQEKKALAALRAARG